jgi:hypothetical protein
MTGARPGETMRQNSLPRRLQMGCGEPLRRVIGRLTLVRRSRAIAPATLERRTEQTRKG